MYRGFNTKFINFILLSILSIIVFSCVPKATEKKALCGANQAFSSVTRTCYSIAEVRYRPVATFSSDTALIQETAKLLTLSYTDKNNNTAISCNISGVNSNLEMISPVIIDGGLLTRISDLENSLSNLRISINFYRMAFPSAATIAADTLAGTYLANFSTYKLLVGTNKYLPSLESNIVNVQNTATNLIAIGVPYIADTGIAFFSAQAQSRLDIVNTYNTSVLSKCFCAGGNCTTYAVPKKNFTGVAGFSYTITDIDGASDIKSSSLTISAYSKSYAHLIPVVQSVYVSGNESSSSAPSLYGFTLGTARDYFSTPTFTYAHNKTVKSGVISSYSASSVTYVDSDGGTPLGKVTACLGLGGSASSDTSCIYVPNDGDLFDVLTPSLATTAAPIGDLTLTALNTGTAGNNVKIMYKDINSDLSLIDFYSSSSAVKFGLVSGSDEVYLRVIGDTIYVFFHEGITTTAQIASLINNDTIAKNLVSSSAGSGALALVSSASTAVSLSGGVSGYDEFSYSASNGFSSSVNITKAAIHITSVVDLPSINSVASRSVTYLENTPSNSTPGTVQTVNLSSTYTAVDGAISCTVLDTSVGLYLSSSPPTCACVANICSATIYPVANVSGPAPITFDYTICSASGCTSATTYNVYFTPINDQPTITGVAAVATINENSTTTPTNYTVTLTTGPGGAGFETSQTVAITAISSNQTVVPDANIVITVPDPIGNPQIKNVVITPVQNQSAAGITITFLATDNGGVVNCDVVFGVDNCNTKTYTTTLNITPFNDPPYITTSVTNVTTNEGGYVMAGPFFVDEDFANSADENTDGVTVSFVSDDQGVLMNSSIKMFYDLNDNGIEDSGEARASGTQLEAVAAHNSKAHGYYFKLTPVGGTSGSANITMTAIDGATYAPNNQTKNYSYSMVVNPVAAIHGGWANISAVGIKTDKSGAPITAEDMSCDYNKSADGAGKVRCSNGAGAADCTDTVAPFATYTTTAPNVLFWDSANKKCYSSYYNTTSSTYMWKQFSNICPVTKSTDLCGDGGNCIFPKIHDSSGVPTSAQIQSYCGVVYGSGVATTGAGAPIGVPAVGSVYFNTTTKECNYSVKDPDGGASNVWADFPDTTANNQYLFHKTSNECHVSKQLGTVISWDYTLYTPSKVSLTWKAFTLSGSGLDLLDSIKGYNVYRREAGTDYEYISGFLKPTTASSMSVTGSTTLTYTDKTAVAGRVYYYTVRPVDNNHGLPTFTPESFSEVRLIAPLPNLAFAHRWMINQEMCNKMHMTTSTTNKVQPSNNFRCPYYGPGSSTVTPGYYDYGSDILVDIAEVGCPYTLDTAGGHCTNGANGCVGSGAPGGSLSSVVNNDIYYDRSGGKCYLYSGAWSEIGTATSAQITASVINNIDRYNSSLNAPLSNITNAQATSMCSYRNVPAIQASSTKNMFCNYNTDAGHCDIAGYGLGCRGIAHPSLYTPTSLQTNDIFYNSSNMRCYQYDGASWNEITTAQMTLPEKKDYMAYSAAPVELNDVQIADLEQGDSLNVQSRCNGSNASGLDAYYTDSDLPTSSYIYSLPGTFTSTIRSIYTGSIPWGYNYSTQSCISRFGIQDLYGNVAEWTKDKMTCNNNTTKICSVDAGTALGDYVFNTTNSKKYAFDLVTGPYSDSSGSGLAGDSALDAFLSSWNYEDEAFDGTKFSIATAMPFNTNYSTLIACPFSGSAATCTNGALGCIGVTDPVSGLVPGTAGDKYLDQSTGKCYLSTGGMAWTETVYTAGNEAGLSYILDIGSTNGITYAELHGDGLIANGSSVFAGATTKGAFAVGGSYLSNTQSGRYTSELVPTSDKRPDVGFRCILPVIKTLYDTTEPFHTYSY